VNGTFGGPEDIPLEDGSEPSRGLERALDD
jgi:hypothetical protein